MSWGLKLDESLSFPEEYADEKEADGVCFLVIFVIADQLSGETDRNWQSTRSENRAQQLKRMDPVRRYPSYMSLFYEVAAQALPA